MPGERINNQPLIRSLVRSPIAGVWLIALALRLLYIFQIADAPFYDLRLGDAEAYHRWALKIAAGDWFSGGVFYQAPLYPYCLAAIYRLFGDGVTAVRVVQAVIGATSCALLASAGMSLFSDRRGAFAGLLLAVYPGAIFLDGLLEKSALVTFLTAALLALLASSAPTTTRRWLAAGIVLGLLSLARENALLLAAPIVLWAWLGPFQSRATAIAAFACGLALTLTPVALRNLTVGGELLLTTSQLGPNFYIGNHTGASGTYEALVVGHGSASDEQADAVRLAQQAAGRALTPAEVSRYWTNRALSDIRSNPGSWLRLLGRKLALLLNAADIADTETRDVYAQWSSVLTLLRPFDFGVLLAAAMAGALVSRRDWRRHWWLYAVGATYAASVIAFYVFERYRFPLVQVLMLLAVPVMIAAADSVRGGSHVAWPTPIGVAIVALVLAHLPIDDPRAARATHDVAIAAVMARDPARGDQALAFYTRALAEAPGFPAAHFGAGTLLARRRQPAEAIPHYRAALAAWPDYAEARYNLGLALAATGDPEGASREYGEALRLRPDDRDARLADGKALLALAKPAAALERYRQVMAAEPRNVKALVGAGVALAQLGKLDEAIDHYQRALTLDANDADAHNNLGGALAMAGRLREAIPHFERAVALNPRDENARRNLEKARELAAER